MKKRKPKRIIRDDVEMFYCPDCDNYYARKFMTKSKRRKDGIGTYCLKHDYLRKEDRRRKIREKSKHKNEETKLNYRVSNERKWYFKHQEKKKFDGPTCVTVRTAGISKLWGRSPHERRACG